MNTQASNVKLDNQQVVIQYICAFGLNAVGLAALDAYSNDATFTSISMAMIGIGFYSCWTKKNGEYSQYAIPALIKYLLTAVLSVFLYMYVMTNRLLDFTSLESGSESMAILITFLMISFSFYVINTETLLFSTVPPLSLIGLTGTMGLDEGVLLYFAVYLVLACLMIIQQNTLSDKRHRTGSETLFSTHIGIALAITLLALIFGFIFRRMIFDPIDRQILEKIGNPLMVQNPAIQDVNDYVPVGPSPSTSNELLMTVRCSERLLWRGQTFSNFNGRFWRDSRPFRGRILKDYPMPTVNDPDFGWPAQSTFEIPDETDTGMRNSVKPVEQLFEIVKGKYRIIFASAEPKTIKFSTPQSFFYSAKTAGTSQWRSAGSKYKVVSLINTATPDQLRKAPANYSEHIKEYFLHTPDSELRVKALSMRLCKGKTNPYDKAMAIQKYLEDNYTYDASTSMSMRTEDIITDFLFETKRGHCTLFATAMAMLCRHAGIPARLATGFASGTYDEEDGKYHVAASDKHAWTELYFPDYGWITFDPSAVNANTNFIDRLKKTLANIKDYVVAKRTTILLITIIALLAVYLIKTELWDRLFRKKEQAAGQISLSQAVANYRRMCKILSKHGFPKDKAATPLEYETSLSNLLTASGLEHLVYAINMITSDFIDARYGAREIPDARLNKASSIIKRLSDEIKTARRQKRFAAIKER